MKKLIVIATMAMLTLGACSKPYCPQTVQLAVNSAIQVCIIAANEMEEKDLLGKTPEEWCDEASNFEPFLTYYISDMCKEKEDNPQATP